VLRFTPTAWAKLIFFRDRGGTEIGGFGLSSVGDLLLVEEFVTVKQTATAASVSFDDKAVADFFDRQVDAGRRPEQFARIWLHTHPGDSAHPSTVDEETFDRVFGRCQWAVMLVLACAGSVYARLRFNTGPGGSIQMPVEVDYSSPFEASDREVWEAEYAANVHHKETLHFGACSGPEDAFLDPFISAPHELLSELEQLDPAELHLFVEELAGRPDLWETESEVDE